MTAFISYLRASFSSVSSSRSIPIQRHWREGLALSSSPRAAGPSFDHGPSSDAVCSTLASVAVVVDIITPVTIVSIDGVAPATRRLLAGIVVAVREAVGFVLPGFESQCSWHWLSDQRLRRCRYFLLFGLLPLRLANLVTPTEARPKCAAAPATVTSLTTVAVSAATVSPRPPLLPPPPPWEEDQWLLRPLPLPCPMRMSAWALIPSRLLWSTAAAGRRMPGFVSRDSNPDIDIKVPVERCRGRVATATHVYIVGMYSSPLYMKRCPRVSIPPLFLNLCHAQVLENVGM
ncbi:hypothetical protein B0T18DRAFT_98032 [Schizothecium vesticola]|uniref:Uncharacterized protein n=1 Tax=Schizothecium vesticola TaxID=314040 RepID=A0AA40F116_9PEZI|nr:hypothetical protein B0T18DRAFT_98032 [Schizothecium vesticola]